MHSYIHNIVTISHHVTMVQLFASEHAATINLTCLAQFLHPCSLRHIPAASASPGSRLLPFRSNHRSLFNFQKLSGSVVSLFLKRSSLCSWESSPNPSGSSLSEFLLRSSSTRCFRVQNESLEEKGGKKTKLRKILDDLVACKECSVTINPCCMNTSCLNQMFWLQ